MEIRLIADERSYAEALAEIKRLWGARAGTAERDRLEILAMLAQRYEREREPLPPLSPLDAIRFRVEQLQLARKDLLPIFGTTARVSEVLSGKRALSLEMIRKLNDRLGIPLESLVQRTPAPRRAKRGRPAAKRRKRAA